MITKTAIHNGESDTALTVHENLTAGPRKLAADVTSETPKKVIINTLRNWCSELGNTLYDAERIKLIVGKLLAVVAERKLYEPEYPSLEEFLQVEVLARLEREGVKLARSTAMEGYQVVHVLGERATPDAYAKLGSTNMTLAARALRGTPPPKVRRRIEAILAKPSYIPVADFRQLVGAGTTRGVRPVTEVLSLRVTPTTAASWRDLLRHPKLEAATGGDAVDDVFSWLVEIGLARLGGRGSPAKARAAHA